MIPFLNHIMAALSSVSDDPHYMSSCCIRRFFVQVILICILDILGTRRCWLLFKPFPLAVLLYTMPFREGGPYCAHARWGRSPGSSHCWHNRVAMGEFSTTELWWKSWLPMSHLYTPSGGRIIATTGVAVGLSSPNDLCQHRWGESAVCFSGALSK
jgi:hypothetical protein